MEMEQLESKDISTFEIPLPPPIALFDLAPPAISDGSYSLYYQKKHLAMLNDEKQFISSKEEVQAKCKKQLEEAEKSSKESQSTGEKQLRNLEICEKCERCGHWIEKDEMKSHLSFHAAPITAGLLLGDKHSSMSRKELLQRNRVTHVVNAAFELKNHFQAEGVKYIHLNLYDQIGEQVITEARRAADFINEAIEGGGQVFVHCAMGKSRSVSAIIMYLINHRQMSYEESLQLIRVNRPMAKPNLGYEKQLREYSLQVLKRN